MRSHVNLLGLLHVTWGGMGLLLGASLLLLAIGAAAIAALLFVVFASALALAGWANLWTGRAIRQHRSPGRTGALMLAVMNLFVLPFGTALAIYTFWVLLHNEVRALFEAADPADGADRMSLT
jgi:high-affinity Fe2+/Pb2+ permease